MIKTLKVESEAIKDCEGVFRGSLLRVKINGTSKTAASMADLLSIISEEYGFELTSITYKPLK